MLTKYISLSAFFISLAIGLFFVYIWGEDMKTIYIYPTPENVDKILFKDKADNCFTFKPVSIDCPSDESKIEKLPIQG